MYRESCVEVLKCIAMLLLAKIISATCQLDLLCGKDSRTETNLNKGEIQEHICPPPSSGDDLSWGCTIPLPILFLWSDWSRTTFISSAFEIFFSACCGGCRDEHWWTGMKRKQRNRRAGLMPLALLRKKAKSSVILLQSKSHLYIFLDISSIVVPGGTWTQLPKLSYHSLIDGKAGYEFLREIMASGSAHSSLSDHHQHEELEWIRGAMNMIRDWSTFHMRTGWKNCFCLP